MRKKETDRERERESVSWRGEKSLSSQNDVLLARHCTSTYMCTQFCPWHVYSRVLVIVSECVSPPPL